MTDAELFQWLVDHKAQIWYDDKQLKWTCFKFIAKGKVVNASNADLRLTMLAAIAQEKVASSSEGAA